VAQRRYQDNYQISPGTDDPADKEWVRYSDDGITTTKGENCAEYLAALIGSGRTESKMTQRVTLAGTVVSMPGKPEFEGKLVQLDLPATSRAMFTRYQMQATVDTARAKRDPATVQIMKLTASVQSKGDNSWTVVNFDYGA